MRIISKITTALALGCGLLGCARQTTPEGGPKDVDKPELLISIPKNNQKNFKAKKLELYFSEDVKLKDPKEEILITPSPGKEIKYEAVGNKIIIDPKEGWADSTTYNIQFRESIQDVTESNTAEELRLAFSTGATIDSLSIYGTIREARKETIPEKITVALYSSDTFNIFNHAPSYFTKSNKFGKFSINNLKAGNYYIYAFEDKNKNLKVESTNEKYGFVKSQIILNKKIDSVSVSLVNIDSRPIKLNSNRSTDKTTLLRFNKNLANYKILLDKNNLLTTYGDNPAEVVVYYTETKLSKDSTQVRLQASDSLNQQFDSLLYIKQGDSKAIKSSFSISTEPPLVDYEKGKVQLNGKTNIPVKSINFDSLILKMDSTTIIRFAKENFKLDTLTKKFQIEKKIDTAVLRKKEKPTNKRPTVRTLPPQIILGKGFLKSIYNDSSKHQAINLPAEELNNTGSVSVIVKTEKKNYYVELLNSSDKLIESFTDKKEHTFANLRGEEYKLRIYIDVNKNGRWDIGNFYRKEEPEPVYFYKTLDGKFKFPIRENWTVGPFTLTF